MPVIGKINGTIIVDRSGKIPTQNTINKRLVNSSNVEWVAWPADPPRAPLMLVKYKGSDTVYGYVGVSRQRAVAAAWAESTGKYINSKIKPLFKAVKIR